MLAEIYVKNIALIEEMRVSLREGFNVVTGETGAGKSIFVGALSLLSGGRISASLVRSREKEAVIEGVFSPGRHTKIASLISKMDFESPDGELVIRRHISAEGKSRIYINGMTATLAQLEQLGEHLIDLTGQHDQQILLKEASHLDALDESLGTAQAVQLQAYTDAYDAYKNFETEVNEWEKKAADRDKNMDFMKFQVSEIDAVKLGSDDEEDKLSEERAKLKNVDVLGKAVSMSLGDLTGRDGSVYERLMEVERHIGKASQADAKIGECLATIVEAKTAVQELTAFLETYADTLNHNPARQDQVESRLFEIHKLKKKYAPSIADIRALRDKMAKELEDLESFDDVLQKKRDALQTMKSQLQVLATQLSAARKKGSKKLMTRVQEELKVLGMPLVKFLVTVETKAEDVLGPTGCDNVRFEMSANPGEAPQALSKVASGGELSRVLLALKIALGGEAPKASRIFDEVDAGVGGAVAEQIGLKLKELSAIGQIIVVTHLPQIAAYADTHFNIHKESTSDTTQTFVERLDGKSREDEIARMLGGVTITAKTRAHAREMLGKR